jgi:hypothetical protein
LIFPGVAGGLSNFLPLVIARGLLLAAVAS